VTTSNILSAPSKACPDKTQNLPNNTQHTFIRP